MPDQGDRKKTLDQNFIETIGLLNSLKLPYWICHGTLLGVIRDGDLIPWDHDIDIAFWIDAFPKPLLINLMISNGYSLKSDGSDYDFAAFTKPGGREVDFNYYRVSKDPNIAFSEWFIPRSKLLTAIDLIARKIKSGGKWAWIMNRMFVFSPFAKLLILTAKKMGVFYSSAGYTSPVNFLKEFEFTDVQGLKVRVPLHHNELLKFTYGADWKIPKKQYDWVKESPATQVSQSRFKHDKDSNT